jgi:DNA repair photolyase
MEQEQSLPVIYQKSLLNKSQVEYANFSINHVFGCAHGCKYPCYAFKMQKRWNKVKSYEDWLQPRLVDNALELLDREIKRKRQLIDFVHMSFMTDPFMYDASNQCGFKPVEDLTLAIIQKLNGHGIKVTTLSKGIYPEILTDRATYGEGNEYGITVVSLDPAFQQKYEPFAAPVHERLNSLRVLHDQGLRTWVSIEPYPTPNLVEQDLVDILDRVSFVDTIIFGKMNYNQSASSYSKKRQFYGECVNQVSDFCRQRNIRYHIKKGTIGSNANDKKIFSTAQSWS